MNILCKLGIHNWQYVGFKDTRFCSRCGKQQEAIAQDKQRGLYWNNEGGSK